VYRTRALGTVAEMVVTDSRALVHATELLRDELARIDRVASRFRADSELCALNDAAGREAPVSADLYEAVEIACTIARVTGGLVDPTVGAAMRDIGYDRDFALVREGRDGTLPDPRPVPGWRVVALDPGRRSITLPAGVSLDLGATAKALAADRAAATIARRIGCGVLVSLGGDLSVAGPVPEGGFPVAIADTCTTSEASETVTVRSGGLATSGTGARHWRLGESEVHHVVDPATGLPSATCWRTVTTTAASCVEANAASTASIVLGLPALEWLQAHALPARLVELDGTVLRIGAWPVPLAHRATRAMGDAA
jgi:FAD:protein FMN transferase